jgi:3-hydroxyanthranilate 3,4-dioxygenase
MARHPSYRPFNFQRWIDENQHHLRPPVGNKHLFHSETQMVVMVVGGPNQRVDFHDDPVEEFFHQIRGDMMLKIAENGALYDVPILEGEVFFLPPHARHSPQRPIEGSVGLVVEGARQSQEKDGFEWFCFGCGALVHRIEVPVNDIVSDLPPLFRAFHESTEHRTCRGCGELHPGDKPPGEWVSGLPRP